MRCLSCNCVLTDFEATRKGVNTGDYIDMCNRCFATISDDIEVLEREDLKENGDEDTIQ
jgi:hypothetical protein